jgi:L-threonylcarbamoyladenylate synthase
LETKILDANIEKNVELCADVLKSGGLIGVPTETVYGLGANALSSDAVMNIFSTKGRQPDNPLIVHIALPADVSLVVREVPPAFEILTKEFWPGPLTLVMKKSDAVPDSVSAGLDTVAVRMPEHSVMLRLIEKSGVPIAAPSANISGSPSPTKAEHVFNDLLGKIPYVLDGGDCRIGVESTVVDITGEVAQILRPGGVTYEELVKVLGAVEVYAPSNSSEVTAPRSPGMKYRHYSPKAPIIAVVGSAEKSAEFIRTNMVGGCKCANHSEIDTRFAENPKKIAALMFDDYSFDNPAVVCFGDCSDHKAQAANLFDSLRRLDSLDYNVILAQVPEQKGLGVAVANRILKAATVVENV